jgi:hypothetical protein
LVISAALFVLCFFQPLLASRTFIGLFIVALEGLSIFALLSQRSSALTPRFTAQLTSDELDLIFAYKVHFMYPGTTRELSAAIALVGMACLPFALLLLWQGHYTEGVIIGVNWFVAGPLSHKLSPFNGLKGMAERGNETALRRFNAWDSASQKLLEFHRTTRASAPD